MPWHEWTDVGAGDVMDIVYIQMAHENAVYLQERVREYLNKVPVVPPVDVSRGVRQQPFPAYLNLIETALFNLLEPAAGVIPWDTPHRPVRVWHGERMDVPTFRYGDVNRWFQDMAYLKKTLEYARRPRLVSGAFCAGGARAQQVIRRR